MWEKNKGDDRIDSFEGEGAKTDWIIFLSSLFCYVFME